MKSVIISFFLSSLYSCSDNFNPASYRENIISPGSGNNVRLSFKRNLLWEYNGIQVIANGERLINRKLISNLSGSRQNNLLICFDSNTNSDTTLYVSQPTIESGNNLMLHESCMSCKNRHRKINLADPVFSTQRFYISLWCDEIDFNSFAKLCISNIKIYRYD